MQLKGGEGGENKIKGFPHQVFFFFSYHEALLYLLLDIFCFPGICISSIQENKNKSRVCPSAFGEVVRAKRPLFS